jgi:uncharacterized protein
MKFETNIFEPPRISSVSEEAIVLLDQRITYPVVLRSYGEVAFEAWGCQTLESLQPKDFEALLAPKQSTGASKEAPDMPELVLFGSGPTQHFLPPMLWQALVKQGIGFETMNTPAACRTYNVLVAEGRKVLAALLIG